jgi:hypothetical protein
MLIPSASRTAVPDFFGQTAPAVNAGEVNISGLEIELKVRKKFGNLNLWGACTWTVAKSKVLYMEDAFLTPAYQKREGFRIGQTKATVVSGVIDSWDKLYTGVLDESNTGRKNILPGSLRVLDYNADGVINSNDNIATGYARQPENTYGFSLGADYKGFSIMAQFYGLYNTTLAGESFNQEFMYDFPTVFPYQLGKTATPEYGVANPTYRALGEKYQGGLGNYGKIDGSVFRLKTMEISYTVPKKLLKSLSIDNLRFFVNGNNLLYFSDLPIDLEGKDVTGLVYPNTRNINVGMNVTL